MKSVTMNTKRESHLSADIEEADGLTLLLAIFMLHFYAKLKLIY